MYAIRYISFQNIGEEKQYAPHHQYLYSYNNDYVNFSENSEIALIYYSKAKVRQVLKEVCKILDDMILEGKINKQGRYIIDYDLM